jgi:hypothetical protein
LKLKYDSPLSALDFDFNLRRYIKEQGTYFLKRKDEELQARLGQVSSAASVTFHTMYVLRPITICDLTVTPQ